MQKSDSKESKKKPCQNLSSDTDTSVMLTKSQLMDAHVNGLPTYVSTRTVWDICRGLARDETMLSLFAGLCTCTQSHTFPWIPRAGKGLNRNPGHAGILNSLAQKKPLYCPSQRHSEHIPGPRVILASLWHQTKHADRRY